MTKDPTLIEQRRQFYNIIFAITQWLAPFFSRFTGIGQDIHSRTIFTKEAFNPETPSGYAFTIWFVIFTLAIIYSFYQALPKFRDDPYLKRIRLFSCIAFAASTIWMLLEQIFGNGWYLVVTIIILLFSSVVAFIRSAELELPIRSIRYWMLVPLFGIMSGWVSIATFLNISSVVREHYGMLGLSPTGFATSIILAAMIFATFILYLSKGNLWYGGTLLWGLIAILVANIFREFNPLIALLVGVFAVFVGYLLVYWNRSKPSIEGDFKP